MAGVEMGLDHGNLILDVFVINKCIINFSAFYLKTKINNIRIPRLFMTVNII